MLESAELPLAFGIRRENSARNAVVLSQLKANNRGMQNRKTKRPWSEPRNHEDSRIVDAERVN